MASTAPDGIHVVINGKLSPTVSVIDVRKLDDLFDGKIKERDDRRRAELGLGPLHTAFDGRQRLYDPVHRQPDGEMEHRQGEKGVRGEKIDPIVQKMDVHYQPGHNHTSRAKPRKPTANGCCR